MTRLFFILTLVYAILVYNSDAQELATGAVTTDPPSYSAGSPAPLSLDTDGNLRTTATVSVGELNAEGAVTAAPPSYPVNTNQPLSLDTSGNLRTSATITFPGSIETVGNIASGQPDSGNPVKVGGVYLISPPTLGSGERSDIVLDSFGGQEVVLRGNNSTLTPSYSNLSSQNSSPGFTGIYANSRLLLYNPFQNFYQRAQIESVSNGLVTAISPNRTLGIASRSYISAANTNSTLVFDIPTMVISISVGNNSSNIAYLKLYDISTAPTCGTGTPVARYIIPASTNGAGSNITHPFGQTFISGLGFCITGGIADSDVTPVAADTILVNFTMF